MSVYVVKHETLFAEFSSRHIHMHKKLLNKKGETHKRKRSRIVIPLSRRWKIFLLCLRGDGGRRENEFITHKTRKYY
jgi:hypothetical protein